MRVGFGYDNHRLAKGRPLILGGVEIPYDSGPLGYSDGDALVHAIIDSILGATDLLDIGRQFPEGDPRWKDILSLKLLEIVGQLAYNKGYQIVNIDSTLIMERPIIKDFIPLMKENIAKILSIDADKVNIKAKTAEGLGFVGRREGIESFAVVLVEERR